MENLIIEHVAHESLALDDARKLFIKYVAELNEDLAFQSLEAELQDPLKKYGPKQKGGLYVAYIEGQPVGCVALQALAGNKCEMKRLYVEPAYRKFGLGEKLVNLIIAAAVSYKYDSMVLDTLDRLKPALSLYRHLGFLETEPYYANPLPGVVYLERKLYQE